MPATKYYKVNLPTDGADDTTWGAENNAAHDSWDDIINTVSTVATGAASTAATASSTASKAQTTANTADKNATSALSTASGLASSIASAQATADAALPKAGGSMSGDITLTGSANLITGASSVAAPAIAFTGQTDTGLHLVSGEIGLVCDGMMGVNVDTDGTVQIGPGVDTRVSGGADGDVVIKSGASGLSIVSSKATPNYVRFYSDYPTKTQLAGSIVAASATSVTYGTTSDARLKRVERPLDFAPLLGVMMYEGVWLADDVPFTGVLAQELQAVLPNLVYGGVGEPGDKDFAPLQVDYLGLVPYLVGAVNYLLKQAGHEHPVSA